MDVKDVLVKVLLRLPAPDGGRRARFELSNLQVDVGWKEVVVKFERIAGRFSTVADLFLNQVREHAGEHRRDLCVTIAQPTPVPPVAI